MGNVPGNCSGCGIQAELVQDGDRTIENPMITLGNGGDSMKSLLKDQGSQAVLENTKLLQNYATFSMNTQENQFEKQPEENNLIQPEIILEDS